MFLPRLTPLFAVMMITAGCASQSIEVSRAPYPASRKVIRIALMPGGGVLAEAVGIQIMAQGFDVVDMSTSTAASLRANLDEIEFTKPSNLRTLAGEYGVDGVLIVKTVAGYDGKPNSATARVLDTANGRLLAGVTWQNGKGGERGSAADNLMRSDVSVAAKKIAEGIGSALR
jgi:hypothetical protein